MGPISPNIAGPWLVLYLMIIEEQNEPNGLLEPMSMCSPVGILLNDSSIISSMSSMICDMSYTRLICENSGCLRR